MNVFVAALYLTVFFTMMTVVRSQPILSPHTQNQSIVIPELEVIPGLEFLTSERHHDSQHKMFNPIAAGLLPIF